MISLLTALFAALGDLMRLRAVGERNRLINQIEEELERDEKEIQKLRESADGADHVRADRLRQRVARRSTILRDLSAADSVDSGRDTSANAGGNLHPDAR